MAAGEARGAGWRQFTLDLEGNMWKMDFILSAKGSL